MMEEIFLVFPFKEAVVIATSSKDPYRPASTHRATNSKPKCELNQGENKKAPFFHVSESRPHLTCFGRFAMVYSIYTIIMILHIPTKIHAHVFPLPLIFSIGSEFSKDHLFFLFFK